MEAKIHCELKQPPNKDNNTERWDIVVKSFESITNEICRALEESDMEGKHTCIVSSNHLTVGIDDRPMQAGRALMVMTKDDYTTSREKPSNVILIYKSASETIFHWLSNNMDHVIDDTVMQSYVSELVNGLSNASESYVKRKQVWETAARRLHALYAQSVSKHVESIVAVST